MDQAPVGDTYAKLILLDERLKAQAKVIVADENLGEWKASVAPMPTQWWWHLTYPMPLSLVEATQRYEKALDALETAEPQPVSEQVIEVLLARDEVDLARNNKPFPEQIAKKIIALDERLKAQAKFIVQNDKLDDWKKSLNKMPQSWWWELKYPIPLSPNQAIHRYAKAMKALESKDQRSAFEKLLEVILAREGVAEALRGQNKPSSESYAQLLHLDHQLKERAKTITSGDTLEEWKKSLGITTQNWWWELGDPDPLPAQAVERYEKAITALETATQPTTDQRLEVLLARDIVEKSQQNQKQPPPERIAKIIELDHHLKACSGVFVGDDSLDEWKKSLKPPQTSWWWELTRPAPLPNQAIDRYDKALSAIEGTPQPSDEQLLETLLARDAVEEATRVAWQNQPVPESIAKQIITLDRRLKKYRMVFNQGNQLIHWKTSLNRQNTWWWDLKPVLMGSEEEPASPRDWVLTGLALAGLGIAAGFIVNTYNVFNTKVEGADVRTDIWQTMATVLQAAGLVTAAGGAATEKGQRTIEKIIVSLRMPPDWQAPAALGISGGLLLVTGGINASLPGWGEGYIHRGTRLMEYGELVKARDSFLQASKFVQSAESKAKVNVALGQINEQLGRYDKAQQYYEEGRLLNDPSAMNALGRLILFQEVARRGSLNISQEKLLDAELLFQRAYGVVEQEERIEAVMEKDPEKGRQAITAVVNLGIVQWFKIKWPASASTSAPVRTQLADSNAGDQSMPIQPVNPGNNVSVENFGPNNFSDLVSAQGRFQSAETLLKFLEEKHPDGDFILDRYRVTCFRDAATVINLALGILNPADIPSEEKGSYGCTLSTGRYTVGPEDLTIIKTVQNAKPVEPNLTAAFETLLQLN